METEVIPTLKRKILPSIIFGDCRSVLKRFRENSFHLIVTSPPYNLGIGYPDWNDNLALNDYFAFCHQWLEECYRVLVTGGRLCLNIPFFVHRSRTNMLFQYLSILREVGFVDREMIVWLKKRRDGEFCCKQKLFGLVASPSTPHIRGVAEMILVMYKERKRLVGHGADISVEEYSAWTKNVWEIDTESDRRHPAPFPVEIPNRLIKLYSYKGNRVLDPFVGRGTTLKATGQLDRNGVGIELSRAYLPLIQEMVGKCL